MPYPSDVTPAEAKANQAMRDAYAAVSAAQDAAIADGHTRYIQCLQTADSPPADGAKKAVDLTRKPPHRDSSLADYGATLPDQIISIEAHEHYLNDRYGNESIDWTLIGRIEIGGKVLVGIGNPDHPDGAGTPDSWAEEVDLG